MNTSHKLGRVGIIVDDRWIGTILLADLPEKYKLMIRGTESLGIPVTANFIKTKLLQDVK